MKQFTFTSLWLLLSMSLVAQDYYRNWTVVNETKKENIALIIANNTYESGGRLEQPIPTARKLEKKLIDEGFDVMVGRDLNRMRMIAVLDEFSEKFTQYDFAMIFYLGHGFQISGENYLIPIDANPASRDDVEVHAINVDYVMRKINDPQTPKVIVLDACRDNPFAQNWSSSERSGSNNGFGNVSAPRNAEIFFTTGEGTRVRDDNPYLQYFMEELKQGSCISDIKRIVSRRIYEFNSDQIPASYGQLFDKVCFGSAPNPDPEVIVRDSDGDGIIDSEDNCPYEYGVASYAGCPAPKIAIDSAEFWFSKGDELYDKAFECDDYREKNKFLEKSFKLTRKAAEAGLMKAQRRLGWMYSHDQGTSGYGEGKENWRNAIYWYTKAAEQGSTSSQKYLAELYRDGEVYDTQDFYLAKFWFEKAIESGDVECMVYLGELYEKGIISGNGLVHENYPQREPDFETARKLYQQCYDKGYLIGKYYLARSYDWEVFALESYRNENTGIEKKNYDINSAIRIYTEAATEGYAPAMHRLFELYCKKANKEYVNQSNYNKQIGIDWLNKAVDTGEGYYLYELSIAYMYGWYGVRKDKNKGEQLKREACEAGYRFACK